MGPKPILRGLSPARKPSDHLRTLLICSASSRADRKTLGATPAISAPGRQPKAAVRVEFIFDWEFSAMAVQQNRGTRSKRGMRRAHDALGGPALSIEPTTGELHRRHHVSADGYYRGRKVVADKDDE